MPDILPNVDAELGTALVSQQLCHHAPPLQAFAVSAYGNVSLNLATFIAPAELKRWERLDLRFRGIILSRFIESLHLTSCPGSNFVYVSRASRSFKMSPTYHMTATAGSDVVQSGRPIFDDFFQHLWPYIGNNMANVVFQMVKRLWLIRIDQ
ncbi:hypothetical protein TNCV_2319961 [Trichonephila clavipes]|nr:hypothetical protein TNCV_2319961 [Trichonephila clavipes]